MLQKEILSHDSQPDGPYWDTIFIVAASMVVLVLLLSAVQGIFGPHELIYLANNFARGSLAVDDMPLIYPDYVSWQGHTYLSTGPLAAIVLIPFLPLLNAGLSALWVSNLFTLVNVLLLYRVLRLIDVPREYQRWAVLLFFGGTAYLAVAATLVSWYFDHIVSLTFLLLAIGEMLSKRRLGLIGLFLGLATMARPTMLCALPFFLWILWKTNLRSAQSKARSTFFRGCIFVILGLAAPLVSLLLYNYLRFGNMFETGRSIDVVGSYMYEQAREYGVFSIVHIPKNLLMMLLQGPLPYPAIDAPVLQFPYLQPSPWGMGIFFTSPALLFVFRGIRRDSLTQASCLSIGLTLVPLLTYYASGWIQFGYRYSLDFMPFMLLLVVRGFSNRNKNLVRASIIASVLINLWGLIWLQRWL